MLVVLNFAMRLQKIINIAEKKKKTEPSPSIVCVMAFIRRIGGVQCCGSSKGGLRFSSSFYSELPLEGQQGERVYYLLHRRIFDVRLS